MVYSEVGVLRCGGAWLCIVRWEWFRGVEVRGGV